MSASTESIVTSQVEKKIRPVIIVPVHKETPTPAELVSIRQLGRIMTGRKIFVLSPQALNTKSYKDLLPGAEDLKVDPAWMGSIRAYNQMMIAPMLYRRLRDYTHMLLHEPDAILLRDELDHWCTQPYDYIGAPWLYWDESEGCAKFGGGANGGLSLCNLDAMRRVTSSWKRWHSWRHVMGDLVAGAKGDRFKFRRGMVAAYPGGLLRGAHRLYSTGWDIFWTTVVPPLQPDFRKAPPEVCVHFFWELASYICYEITKHQLPFGLHAWPKYDFGFLRPHMINCGIDFSGFDMSGSGIDPTSG